MSISRRSLLKLTGAATLAVPATSFATKGGEKSKFSNVDVVIICGQSNALGFAGLDENFDDSALVEINEGSYYFFGGKIHPLTHYMKSINGGVSSGSAWSQFSNTYKEITGRSCVFIQCARGSTPLTDLAPPSNNYKRMVEETNRMISAIGKKNIANIFAVFHQGEADQIAKTRKEDYKNLLTNLGASLKNEVGISKFFVFKVGSPQRRADENISAIKAAQDEICKEQDLFVMAFSGCSAFKRENLLLGSDGVHYSIYGYNLMGQIGAENVASNIETKTTITKDDVSTYGSLSLTSSYDWKYIAASFCFGGVGVKLLSNTYPAHNDGLYATSHIIGVECSGNIIKATPSFPLSKILSKNASAECSEPSVTLHPLLKVEKDRPIEISCVFDVSFDVQIGSENVFRYASNEPNEALDGIIKVESDNVTGYLKITHPKTHKAPDVYSSGADRKSMHGAFNIQHIDSESFVIMPVKQSTGSRFCIKLSGCEMDLSRSNFANMLMSFDIIAA